MSALSRLAPPLTMLALAGAGTVALRACGLHLPAASCLALGVTAGGGWVGWAIRQAWRFPRQLEAAELLWAKMAPAEDVLAALAPAALAVGEVGYRSALLRARAHLALGDRPSAWVASLEAQIVRLPFWLRWQVRAFLRAAQTPAGQAIPPSLLRRGDRLAARLPASGRFHHLMAVLHLKHGGEASEARAWHLLSEAVPRASEDVLLLEDLMLTALHRLDALPPQAPGREDVLATFDETLHLLLHRHGDPRLAWDRVSPARQHFQEGMHEEVFALAHSLPPSQRPADLWDLEIRALMDLGDVEGAAHACQEALELLPSSFRVRMAAHAVSLARQRHDEALQDLDRAASLVGQAPEPAAALAEWRLRRAEFAFYVDGHAEEAWALLDKVPAEARGNQLPPLEVELKAALGRHEEAYQDVTDLLKIHPEHPELLFLQADCLAGMGAWEALLPFLNHLPAELRERATHWHLVGLAHSHLNHKLQAREALERAALMEPTNGTFVLDAGHACMDLAEWERAAQHWRQVLRLEEANEEALVQLAETRRLAHDAEGAKRYLRECLLHHPESALAQQYLAELEAN